VTKLHEVEFDLEDLADLLEKNGEFLAHNPSCTYLVRRTWEKLEEASKYIGRDEARIAISQFVSFLENYVWNSGSSTISGVLDIPTQADFVKHIAKCMSEMANVLRERKFGKYLAIEDYWKRDFSAFLENARTSSTKLRSRKGAILRLVQGPEEWKRKFGELINKHGLVMQEEKPIFLLKSGYRSIYFFNPTHLISKSNVKSEENQEIMNEFKEVLKIFVKHLKDRFGERNVALLLTQKIGGEDPGTSQFAPLFTELGLPSLFLDPNLDVLKGPTIEGVSLIIPFDGVTTTGKTVDTIIDRYEKILKEKPQIYALIWNRSPYSEWKNVPIWSIGPPPILLPEILNLTIASYDSDLGYWWSSLLMFHNYLKDIYLYAGQDLAKYEETRGESEKLIIDSYEVEEVPSERKDERTAHLFGYFDTELTFSEFATYLLNVHILCWNTIFDINFGDRISRLENSVEYIETMLRVEKAERITMTFCSDVLKQCLKNESLSFPKLIDPWDKIHRIFVLKSADIIGYLKDKYKECKILNVTERESMTLEEAYKLIDETLKNRREVYKRFNRDIKSAIKEEPTLRELMLRHLKQFYEIKE